MEKERIDIILVQKGLAETRSKAQQYIRAGHVYLNNTRVDKPSLKIFKNSDDIEIKGDPIPYVSRGGLKLEKALRTFDVSVKDKITMDVGASTGGFTDCLLQNGAKRVYAIDVGTDQLSAKLREDKRVISMEKTNVRYMSEEDIKEKANFVTIDVSFISLKLILPAIKLLTTPDVDIICLIKPQFEAGKDRINRNGIVRNKKVHIEVLMGLYGFCNDNSLYFNALSYSPVKGGDGNIEYLAHISKNIRGQLDIEELIENVVESSHSSLR